MSIKTARKIRITGSCLFFLYMALLLYLVFFSEYYGRTADIDEWRYNLTPLREIGRFWICRKELGLRPFIRNVLGNIAAFLPLGSILPVLNRKWRSLFKIILAGFALSCSVEILQLLTRVGCFDVDDLLLNTIGAAAGYGLFAVCNLIRRKWDGKEKRLSVHA